MRGTEKSLSDFSQYFGTSGKIKQGIKRKCGENNRENIRPRIVTKKLQILDKWELQEYGNGKIKYGHVYGRGGYTQTPPINNLFMAFYPNSP